MTKQEKDKITSIVQDELKKFFNDSLDKELENILSKKNSKVRKEMIKTIKDALESAFKMFWLKRDFWKSDIN